VRRSLSILFVLGLAASFCRAETRWCSIVGRGPNDTLVYPPIARVARVQGVVLSRIFYLPNGKVKGIERISGPQMLSGWVGEQLSRWTIKTDASGEGLCQSLVIADFRLHASDEPIQERRETNAFPSILRLSIDGEVYIISCPGGVLETHWTPLSRLKYALKRTRSKIFPHHGSGPHCCKPIS
jgi:hypothetical protein